MSEKRRTTKAEQREATTQLLIQVAREMFAKAGYGGTATEDIVQQAGVTRGALYHHFGSKEGLFAAVLEATQQDVARRIDEASAQTDDLWEQLLAGCRAFLAASLDPHVQRIMLIDAPAVLGWEAWRKLDEAHSMRMLRDLLGELRLQGVIRAVPLDALAHLLSGAMNEAALWIARADQPEKALHEATTTLETLLLALKQV
ncbi:MAG: TetR/AcrR family transcriptional regulator [bacterium]|nr:TetR/AcrR family transcriptional regulator [bacterium]